MSELCVRRDQIMKCFYWNGEDFDGLKKFLKYEDYTFLEGIRDDLVQVDNKHGSIVFEKGEWLVHSEYGVFNYSKEEFNATFAEAHL